MNLVRNHRDNFYSFNSSELDDGIELCVKKTKKLLNASRLLASNEEYLSYALGLYLFALEEYGKSVLLQKSKSSTEHVHLIDKKIFGFRDRNSHRKKIREGSKNLPSKTIKVEADIEIKQNYTDNTRTFSLKDDSIMVSVGGSQTGTFSSEGDIDLVEEIRWRSFYLDWDNDQRFWKNEFRPNQSELLKLITDLENCLN